MTQNKENYKDALVLVVISLDASETFTRVRKTPSHPIKLLFYMQANCYCKERVSGVNSGIL